MFTVVIPLHNKESSIQDCLRSVLNQTFKETEIIIVDDGSTDESVKRAKEIGDTRIKLIQKKNGGVCSARNQGIEFANYDYIALLDADDVWEPEYLAEQKKLTDDFPDAVLWSCAYGQLAGETKEQVDHSLPNGFRNYVKDYFNMKRKTDLFCSSSVVIHKNAFEKAGLFDTRIKFSEDLDMWYRIIVRFPVVFYNKTLVYYRQDAENRAMELNHTLADFLPYYVYKYNTDDSINNRSFLYYINNWSAVKLLSYYFDSKDEREDAKKAVRGLDYSRIKKKYFWLYKTPFPLGYLAYKLLLFKKKFGNKLSLSIK